MSDPDLTILRNNLAFQTEFTKIQGEMIGDYIGRYLESETNMSLLSKSQTSLTEAAQNYSDRNKELKSEIEDTKASLAAAQTNVDALERQVEDLRVSVSDLREKKRTLTSQRQEAEEKITQLLELVSLLEKKLQKSVDSGAQKRGKHNKAQTV
jgi:prophage DNA circulation protein